MIRSAKWSLILLASFELTCVVLRHRESYLLCLVCLFFEILLRFFSLPYSSSCSSMSSSENSTRGSSKKPSSSCWSLIAIAKSSSKSGDSNLCSGVLLSLATGAEDPGVEGGDGVAVDAWLLGEDGDGESASSIWKLALVSSGNYNFSWIIQ
jgi:hypothetical protein